MLCFPLQWWQMSRRLDSPLRGPSPKRSTRPDRVWSAGWWTQKQDAPGKPKLQSTFYQFTIHHLEYKAGLPVQIHRMIKHCTPKLSIYFFIYCILWYGSMEYEHKLLCRFTHELLLQKCPECRFLCLPKKMLTSVCFPQDWWEEKERS